MPTKVYYNSACPVCKAGINDQRQRMEKCGISDIEWVDVHDNPDRVAEVDKSLEHVRERLYVKGDQGEIDIGIDAFIHLWQRTPGQRWLATLFQWPIIKPLARLAYNGFAKLLYRWNRVLKHW
jgi:predicted DCC family thiol-disulfide oxidoreductase YuxK